MLSNIRTPIINKDTLGIFCSLLCLIHCIVLPVALSALSINYLESDFFHALIIGPACYFAWTGFQKGYLQHGRKSVAICGFIGISLMVAGILIDNESLEKILTIIGVSIVSLSHFINHRLNCFKGICCNNVT